MKILKLLLLISAGITVVLRLFLHNNSGFLNADTIKLLNIISIAAAIICVICALVWVLIIKKEEREGKEK